MNAAAPTLACDAGLRHEAFLYRGTAGLVEGLAPFVRAAVEAEEPVMVALVDVHWLPLRDALGSAARDVHHADMTELGRNPARIIPAWTAFVDRYRDSGRPLRGVGEPIWAGRTRAEVAESQLHEALLNVALGPRTPLRLLCPYDVDALSPDVVDEAHRSHPTVGGASEPLPSPDYGGTAHARRLWEADLPPAPRSARTIDVGRGSLAGLRAAVRDVALAGGLDAARTGDLVLAVTELAANSIDHGGGRGVLRLWSEGDAIVCEVQDSGWIDDVLVGRAEPTATQPRGRGVWMVNQLCDLVQIRSSTAGTLVRVRSGGTGSPAR